MNKPFSQIASQQPSPDMSQAAPKGAPVLPPAPSGLVSSDPPRATGFIVTLYGDAVAPRGGVLSMRSLIETGAVHGLSESLIRTAVSRLVGAGRLAGARVGRASHYRLTEAAMAEFAAAARVLYDPPPAAEGWLLAFGADAPGRFWAPLGPALWAAPDRADIDRPDALTMAAEVISAGRPGAPELQEIAAAHWPLEAVAQAYRAFLGQFGPLVRDAEATARLAALAPEAALALRLRLVHAYRAAALDDPRLPGASLPRDWPGAAARTVFVECYLSLTARADERIGAAFRDDQGPLPQETGATRARLSRLRREAARDLSLDLR